MFTTIRARIVALCVAIVVAALAVNAALNYVVASSYNDDTIEASLAAVQNGHIGAIGDWVAAHGRAIASLKDAALEADPVPALKQVAEAGGFIKAYVGFADKSHHFSDATGLKPDYDPT